MKNILWSVFYVFVERFSFVDVRKNSILRLVWYTLRFRLVKLGLIFHRNEFKLKSLKNKYSGERCFIIGNGPSLNKIDLKKIKNEYTFGVNAIYLNFENMGFYPNFYVVEDYLVAEDRANEINKYKGSEIKFFGTYLDYVLKKDTKSVHLNVKMNYLEPFEPYFSTNALQSLGVGGTVSFLCLQLAYYMGFNSVYLIGFDHAYNIPKYANLNDSTVIESIDDDVNHFSKDYFGKGFRWHDPKVERMEQGFLLAKKMFELDNRKVYNASFGGSLEVFERVEFESLFKNEN